MTIPLSLVLFDGDSTTGATTGAGAGVAAAVVITAFFFGAGTGAGAREGARVCDAAGLSPLFFLELDAQAEDGEERLPSPSLLRFLDE